MSIKFYSGINDESIENVFLLSSSSATAKAVNTWGKFAPVYPKDMLVY